MAKTNNKQNNKFDVPKDLKEHTFYGFDLDDEQKALRDAIWDTEKLIVFCTPKFYRFDNVRLTCEKYHIPLVQDLHPLIIANKIISKL